MFQKILFIFLLLVFVNACAPRPTPVAATATITLVPTNTLTPTPTLSPSPTPASTPIGGGTGRLIFSIARGNGYFKGYRAAFPDLKGQSNIFTSNLDGTNLVPLTNNFPGYGQIESISPDGNNILVSSFEVPDYDHAGSHGTLYRLEANGSEQGPITDSFFRRFNDPGAIWLDNTRMVYEDLPGSEYGLFKFDTDSNALLRILASSSGMHPKLYKGIPERILYADRSYVYWMGFDEDEMFSTHSGLWRSSLDGFQQEHLTIQNFIEIYWNRLFISPDGKWLVWDSQTIGRSDSSQSLYIAPLDGDPKKSRLIGTLPNRYRFLFSSDSSKVVLLPFYGSQAEDPFVRNLPIYSLSLKDFSLQSLFVPKYAELSRLAQESLSPDGRMVIINTFIAPRQYTSTDWKATIINLETEMYSEFNSEGMGLISWMPAPRPITETPAPTATVTPTPNEALNATATQEYADLFSVVQKEYDAQVIPSLDGEYRRLENVAPYSAKNGFYEWTPSDFKADNFIVRANVVMETAQRPAADSGCGFVFGATSDTNAFVFLKQDGIVAYGMTGKTFSETDYHKLGNPSNFQITMVVYQKKLRLFIDDKQILIRDDLAYVDGFQGGWGPAVLSGSVDNFGTRCSFTQLEFWQIKK